MVKLYNIQYYVNTIQYTKISKNDLNKLKEKNDAII